MFGEQMRAAGGGGETYRVDVPGLGVVEFPANLSPADVEKAITAAIADETPIGGSGYAADARATPRLLRERGAQLKSYAPAAAGTLAGIATGGGVMLPALAAGATSAMVGGDAGDVVKNALGAGAAGVGGNMLRGFSGLLRRAGIRRAPTGTMSETPSPILDAGGKPARMIPDGGVTTATKPSRIGSGASALGNAVRGNFGTAVADLGRSIEPSGTRLIDASHKVSNATPTFEELARSFILSMLPTSGGGSR